MSPHERKEEPTPQAPANPPEAPDKSAAAPDAKPGLKYVFKIAPADPQRNSIDFEDVADK